MAYILVASFTKGVFKTSRKKLRMWVTWKCFKYFSRSDQFGPISNFAPPYLFPNSSPNLIPPRASSPKSSGRRGWIPDLEKNSTPPKFHRIFPTERAEPEESHRHPSAQGHLRKREFQVNSNIFHLDNHRRKSQHHCWQCRLGRSVAAMSRKVHRVAPPNRVINLICKLW